MNPGGASRARGARLVSKVKSQRFFFGRLLSPRRPPRPTGCTYMRRRHGLDLHKFPREEMGREKDQQFVNENHSDLAMIPPPSALVIHFLVHRLACCPSLCLVRENLSFLPSFLPPYLCRLTARLLARSLRTSCEPLM